MVIKLRIKILKWGTIVFTILLSMLTSQWGLTQNTDGLVAVELSYDRSTQGSMSVTVHLTKYISCSDSVSRNSETVHVHAVEDVIYMGSAELSFVKESEIRFDSLPECVDSMTTSFYCIKVVKYSGEVMLSGSPGGFDITWGHCCLPSTLMNIAATTEPSYALVLRADWMGEVNKSPQIKNIPNFLFCSSEENLIDFKYDDPDEDEIRIKSSVFYSSQANSTMPDHYFMEASQSSRNSRTQATVPSDTEANVRTEKPPLTIIPTNIKSEANGVMEDLSATINNEKLNIKISKSSAGTFVQALEVQEIRNQQIISSHPLLIFWRGM